MVRSRLQDPNLQNARARLAALRDKKNLRRRRHRSGNCGRISRLRWTPDTVSRGFANAWRRTDQHHGSGTWVIRDADTEEVTANGGAAKAGCYCSRYAIERSGQACRDSRSKARSAREHSRAARKANGIRLPAVFGRSEGIDLRIKRSDLRVARRGLRDEYVVRLLI